MNPELASAGGVGIRCNPLEHRACQLVRGEEWYVREGGLFTLMY